jgi:excinuclease UvrABC nuclease subunit
VSVTRSPLPLVAEPERLKATLAALPLAPGCYLFRDLTGRIIYIGKSIALRRRVRSYFSPRMDEPGKTRRLRGEIASIEVRVTGSELEALLLESRLVKEHLPGYNRQLRNYKHYPFVRVDLSDPLPRLDVTRHLAADGALYYGPYHSAGGLYEVVDLLSNTLRLRTCTVSGARIQTVQPCLRMHIERCDGPCIQAIDLAAYWERVREACRLFEGDSDDLLQLLQRQLEDCAERLLFEQAARYRDAIASIRRLLGQQNVLRSAVANVNLVALCRGAEEGEVTAFLFRAGRLLRQETLPAETWRGRRLPKVLRGMAATFRDAERLVRGPIGQELVDQINIITAWLRRHSPDGRSLLLPPDADEAGLVAEMEPWLRREAARLCGD